MLPPLVIAQSQLANGVAVNATSPAPPPAMMPVAAAVLIALVCSIFFSGLSLLVVKLATTIARKGKVLMVWVDGDSGGARLEFRKREGNEVIEGKGATTKRFILNGRARLNATFASWGGPLWIMHRRNGWDLEVPPGTPQLANMKVPTDEETVEKDPVLRTLSYSNPASYHHAIVTNEARDALEANREGDDWKLKLIPFAFAVTIFTLLLVAYIVVKMASAGVHPAGA